MTDLTEARKALLQGVSQYDVDFVIPRVGIDLPLGIDPFLLFKSRDPELRDLHDLIVRTFNHGIQLIAKKQLDDVRKLFRFPEVSEIGLGYTQAGKRGAGVGTFITELIIETMVDSPMLRQRGIKHVEEMQLFSSGVGPDRISDLTANLIKDFLIRYTQKQCLMWKFPLQTGVPIENVFDQDTGTWYDDHFDLPVSPHDGSPILLVPRRIVRALPWINYNDFLKMEFSTYLRAKRVRERVNTRSVEALSTDNKAEIVAINRRELIRVDSYVARKEADKQHAQPSSEYVIDSDVCEVARELAKRLADLPPGRPQADTYQRLILEILNFLFNPELIDGELEVRTIDGTERRDIIFTNDSDLTFWDYIRGEHSGLLLMFETKNVGELDPTHFNQTATYLGDRIGRIGFIVTRNAIKEAQQRKAYSIYNDSNPRKVILVFFDSDIKQMLDMRCKGNDPMRYVQKHYREFRQRVQ